MLRLNLVHISKRGSLASLYVGFPWKRCLYSGNPTPGRRPFYWNGAQVFCSTTLSFEVDDPGNIGLLFCTNRRLPESIIPVTNYMSIVSALYKTPGQASHESPTRAILKQNFITSTPHVINVTLISVKFTKQNTLNDRKYTYTKYHIISYWFNCHKTWQKLSRGVNYQV